MVHLGGRVHAGVPGPGGGARHDGAGGVCGAGRRRGGAGRAAARPLGQRPGVHRQAIRAWVAEAGLETLYIDPGAPWENGYAESFNSKVRDELLNAEEFASLLEAQVLGKDWKRAYNHERPHSSLGYRTPAEFGALCPRADSAKPPPARGHNGNG